MKKYLPYIDRITLAAAMIGMALRLWLLQCGEDEKGLYPAHHISWTLLLILSAAVAIGLFLLAGCAGKSRSYRANFPASTTGAAGYLAAAIGLAVTVPGHFSAAAGWMHTAAGLIGLAAAAMLLWGALLRYRGDTPPFPALAVPCLYFALRLFCTAHLWRDEPELHRFVMGFFATAAACLASYQLWGFSVGLGNRSSSLLWSLLGVYLCLVAVPGSSDWPLYLTVALWLLTNLCPKKSAPFRPRVKPAPKPEPAPAPEEPQAADSGLDPDIEALLAEILRETEEMKE